MNRTQLIAAFVIFCITIPLSSYGQKSQSCRGVVLDKSTSSPVVGAHIYLPDGKSGSATDKNGFFQVTGLEKKEYQFTISALGYQTQIMRINFLSLSVSDNIIQLKPQTLEIESLIISGKAQEKETETNVSVHYLDAKRIQKLPAYGASSDLAQYIQMIPGVIFTGDQGGQLYLRGGSQSMNKFLLDGLSLYNPIHSMGVFSVIDTDIIQGANIYTGGFGAEFGGAISSVMDVNIRTGSMKDFKASFGIDPFQTSLLAEGPIIKSSEKNQIGISYLLSGKKSLIDRTGSWYSHIDKPGLPFTFRDFLGKVTLRGRSGDNLNILIFNNTDKVNYPSLVNMNWQSSGAGIQATIFPVSSKAQIHPYLFYSSYKIDYQAEQELPSHSTVNGFQAGIQYNYILGYDQLQYGIEVNGNETNTTVYNQLGRKIFQKDFTTDLSSFAKYKKVLSSWILDGGINLIYYGSLQKISPEPRLRIKYQPANWIDIKFATGMYSQNLFSTHSDRKIVNFFQGFLSSPEGLQTEFFGKQIKDRLQKARHYVIGFDLRPLKTISFSTEFYLMDYNQLINVNYNRLYEDNEENQDKPEYLRKEFIIEEGKSYGADFQFRYQHKNIQLWAVYSYSRSSRSDEIMMYIPHYDRRHTVNVLCNYVFGRDQSWDFSIRWNFGSGLPFTQTQGFFEEINPYDAENYYTFTRLNGELAVILARYNLGRLPTYHRLDLSLKKTIHHRWGSIDLVASVLNAYDRSNLFYIERLSRERADQLPIIPTIGMKFKF